MKILIAISTVLTLCAGAAPAQSLYNDTYVLSSCCEPTIIYFDKTKIEPKQYRFSTKDSISLDLNTGGAQITYLSDFKGELQFVYDGLLIHDNKGEVVKNPFPSLYKNGQQWYCDTFNSVSICDGWDYITSIFLNSPSERYMIFELNREHTTNLNHRTKGNDILCTTIEKNPQTQSYKVVEYFSISLSEEFSQGISITRHADGKSWWVIIPFFRTGHFVSLLISDDGKFIKRVVSEPQYPFISPNQADLNLYPFIEASPDGSKLALLDSYRRNIVLYNMDRCSGMVHNPRKVHFDQKAEGWYIYVPWYLGMSFSPNSRFLYFGDYYSQRQYDTEDVDIEASEVIMGERFEYDPKFDTVKYKIPPHIKGSSIGYATQTLGQDGKIYINNVQEFGFVNTWNAIIEHPNEKGIAAGLKPFGFYNYAQVLYGPNTPNFDLEALPLGYCEESQADIDLNVKVSDGRITINLKNIPEGVKVGCVKIFDMMGRVVYQNCEELEPFLAYEKQYQLKTELFSTACYVASIQFDNGKYVSQKFAVF